MDAEPTAEPLTSHAALGDLNSKPSRPASVAVHAVQARASLGQHEGARIHAVSGEDAMRVEVTSTVPAAAAPRAPAAGAATGVVFLMFGITDTHLCRRQPPPSPAPSRRVAHRPELLHR